MPAASGGAKPLLRRQMRERRSAISPALRRKAAAAVAGHAARLRARNVAAYFPAGSELDSRPLLAGLARRGCRIYLPKVVGTGLLFLLWRKRAPLRPNRYGIGEPVGTARRHPRRMDLILLPLLGFDGAGTRLGTGGGYYDRTLAFQRPHRRPLLVGLAFSEQELPRIPADVHDVKLDAVLTPRGLRFF